MNETERKNLWAPWRIEYILGPKDGACFLCGRERDSGAKDDFMVVGRGESVFVMLNAFPYNAGHLLVAPYAHVDDIAKLPPDTLNELMGFTVKAKQLLAGLMRPDGFNIGFNLGAAAGAGLESHVHEHIVPRWVGDTNFMPVLDDTRVVPQALRDTAALLRSRWV